MNQLRQIIAKVNLQLYAVAALICLLVAGSAYFLVLLVSHSTLWSLIAMILAFVGMAFQQRLFQSKKTEAIKLIHQKLGDTEYSLDLLNVEQPNLAEQLQLERLFSKITYQTPLVFDQKLFLFLGLFVSCIAFYFFSPSLKSKSTVPFFFNKN